MARCSRSAIPLAASSASCPTRAEGSVIPHAVVETKIDARPAVAATRCVCLMSVFRAFRASACQPEFRLPWSPCLLERGLLKLVVVREIHGVEDDLSPCKVALLRHC